MLHKRHAPPTASDEEGEDHDAPRAVNEVGEFPIPEHHDVLDQQEVTEVREIQPLRTTLPHPPPFTPPTRAGSGVSTSWDTGAAV